MMNTKKQKTLIVVFILTLLLVYLVFEKGASLGAALAK